MRERRTAPLPPLKASPHDGELPLSLPQHRLWLLNKIEPDSSLYNTQLAFRISGKLDGLALEQSVAEIVRRHQVLRSTFSTLEGRAVTQITAAGAFHDFLREIVSGLIEYRERVTPRTRVDRKIFTSTDYPRDQALFLHNEGS